MREIFGILPKGRCGYLASMRKAAIIRAALFVGFSVLLVAMGRLVFRDMATVFIICAVISAIPSAGAVVQLIMFLRFKGADPSLFSQVEEKRGEIPVFYDLVFTTEKGSFESKCLFALNKSLSLYMENGNRDMNDEFVRHLSYMAKKNGFKNWNFKIFNDLGLFLERLNYLNKQGIKQLDTDRKMLELVKEITL
ncbi:MAG: hypothetical protein J6P05_06980 [Lachnospiraceae bacterium]|nr:hypothetical protein [Lachnospiraceae bacterium]